MASKYVAAKDFDSFKKGDDVTAGQAGDNADAWLADGRIVLRDADSTAPTAPTVTVAGKQATPLATPEAEVKPARPASYVTLGSSPTGMPAFVVVEQKTE